MDIRPLISRLSEAVPLPEEHYLAYDGLIFCAKCNTPAQGRVRILGEEIVVNCLCECRQVEVVKEREAYEAAQKAQRIQANIEAGLRDRRYRGMTFEASDMDLSQERAYCDNFADMLKMNAGIMYLGACGSGKTFRAGCIANSLLETGYRVYMDNITALCCTIQSRENKQDLINEICGYDLLILDDVGAERRTEYMIEMVYNIIDSRYRAEKPLIITTNLTLDELRSPTDGRLQRTYDRLFEMCSYPIVLKEGRRRSIGNDKYKLLKGILG